MDNSSNEEGGRGTGDACSPAPADDADWVVDALLAALAPKADEAARDADDKKAAEKRPAESVFVPTVARFDEASGKMVKAPDGCTGNAQAKASAPV